MADAANDVLVNVGGALAALSALATASFGLLDASKAWWGGTSNFGLGHLRRALAPFSPALEAAVGQEWWLIVRSNWIAGKSKSDQKAVIAALLKLGLTDRTAPALAVGSRVDPDALAAVAAKLETGAPLKDADLNLIGRMTASVEAVLDAAFERADQHYRNASRFLAGVVAVGVSIIAQQIWSHAEPGNAPGVALAVLVGLLAVPVAPVAKDLSSALSTAMQAIKSTRAVR